MATLALTGSRELIGRLPSQESVRVGIVSATAEENADGTWTIVGYAGEADIPALEALGYAVAVLTTDAGLMAMWDEIDGGEPPGPVA